MDIPQPTPSPAKETDQLERFTRAVIASSANLLARSRSHAPSSQASVRDPRRNDARASLATLKLGDRVQGVFMGQRFEGHLVAITPQAGGQNYRISIRLNQAIDLVTFASFSNFRRRLNAIVGKDGVSAARHGDGRPHMQIDL